MHICSSHSNYLSLLSLILSNKTFTPTSFQIFSFLIIFPSIQIFSFLIIFPSMHAHLSQYPHFATWVFITWSSWLTNTSLHQQSQSYNHSIKLSFKLQWYFNVTQNARCKSLLHSYHTNIMCDIIIDHPHYLLLILWVSNLNFTHVSCFTSLALHTLNTLSKPTICR